MACGQIESGRARHALVVGADFLSRFLDCSDRDTASLFADATSESLASCDCLPEDIGLFVYHQANSRIIRAVGERLGLPDDRVVDYVDRFANSSTATLPIALSVAEAEGRLTRDDLVLLAAFGGGLTWGATVMQWSTPAPSPPVAQPSVMPTV